MGKRELLLLAAFVLMGVGVYHVTAPAAAPGERGFSVSRLLEHMRREVRGNRASSEVKTSTTVPLRGDVSEVRFDLASAALTIVGEDRDDISCDLSVSSTGFDDAEAQKYAGETKLKVSDGGPSVSLSIEYPEPGQQRATLAVRIPKHLSARVSNRGGLEITDLTSAELVDVRGKVVIKRIAGRLVIAHRGGSLDVSDVAKLKLTSRGSNVTLKGIRGEALLQTQAGELSGSDITGTIELESNGTRVTFADLGGVKAPLRINASGGTVTLGNLRGETRIDARDTTVDVTMTRPAPIAIYNEADRPVRLTLPPGGVQLDALVNDGRLVVPDGLIKVSSTEGEQRASGALNGGGPTITVRTSHGDIEIRTPAEKPVEKQ